MEFSSQSLIQRFIDNKQPYIELISYNEFTSFAKTSDLVSSRFKRHSRKHSIARVYFTDKTVNVAKTHVIMSLVDDQNVIVEIHIVMLVSPLSMRHCCKYDLQ